MCLDDEASYGCIDPGSKDSGRMPGREQRKSKQDREQKLHPTQCSATVSRQLCYHPLLRCSQKNVNREKMPSPSVEIAVTGAQNKRILRGLLFSLLAAKNQAKNKMARIQNQGEKKLSRKPPITAARPVALELLAPLSARNNPGTSRPTKTAANALSAPRTIVIGSPHRSRRCVFYSEKAYL